MATFPLDFLPKPRVHLSTPHINLPDLITQIIQLLFIYFFQCVSLVMYNVTATSQITAERLRHFSITAPLELQVNPVQKVQCFKWNILGLEKKLLIENRQNVQFTVALFSDCQFVSNFRRQTRKVSAMTFHAPQLLCFGYYFQNRRSHYLAWEIVLVGKPFHLQVPKCQD